MLSLLGLLTLYSEVEATLVTSNFRQITGLSNTINVLFHPTIYPLILTNGTIIYQQDVNFTATNGLLGPVYLTTNIYLVTFGPKYTQMTVPVVYDDGPTIYTIPFLVTNQTSLFAGTNFIGPVVGVAAGTNITIQTNSNVVTINSSGGGGGGGGGGTIYAGTNVTLTTTNVGTNTYQVVNTLTTPFFEATDYGCVGDNATDNSLAMSNLFNLASVKGGTVHFKAGVYRTQGGHFITNNITILGDGMVLDNLGNTDLNGTVIYTIANTTSNLFTFTGTNGFIHNITLYDGVPGRTNRSFVVVSNINNSAGAKVDFDRVMFAGGWNGVTIQRQYYINFHNCTFHDWLHDGIMFSNSVDQDYGGMLIDNCAFLEENYASEAGLHFYGCGETHIVNCAWNNADASQTSYTNCIRIDFATANMSGWYGTSSLTIMGCLFNGSVGDCIYGDSPGTGTWEDLRIIGNEFNNTHGGWTNNGVQFYPLHLTQGIGINSIAADNSMVDTSGSGNYFALLKGVTNFFFGTIQSDLPLNTPGASLNVWKDDGQNQGIHIAGLINGGFTNDYYQTPLFTGNITITNVGSANTLIHIPALSYFDTVVYSNNVYTADEMWMGFDSLSGAPSPWQVDNELVGIGANVTAMSMDYAGNMHINNGLGITGFLTLGGPFSTAYLTNFNTGTGMTPTGRWFINQLTLANGHTSTGGGDTNLFLGFFGNLTGTASCNPTPAQLAAQGTAVTNALAVQGTAVTNAFGGGGGSQTPIAQNVNYSGYSALQVGTLQLSNAVGSNTLSAGGFTNNTVSATSYLFGTNSSLQASNVTVNGGGFLSTFPGNYSTTNWVGTNVYDYWWTNTSAANGGKVQFFTNYSTASFTWKVQALICEVCRTNPIQAYSWQWTEYIVTNSSSGCGAVLTNTIGAYSHAGGLQSLATSATTDVGFGLYFGLNGTNTLSDLVHVTVIMP